MTENDNTAYSQGYEDYLAGKNYYHENPYDEKIDPQNWMRWRMGWEQSEWLHR